jgi:hypothetical protein
VYLLDALLVTVTPVSYSSRSTGVIQFQSYTLFCTLTIVARIDRLHDTSTKSRPTKIAKLNHVGALFVGQISAC